MKRKYFIAFTFSKQAHEQAVVIDEDLHQKFGTKRRFVKYPPHLLLKIPFTGLASNRKELIDLLTLFVKDRKDFSVAMGGFNYFNSGLIYWSVQQKYVFPLMRFQRDICNALQHAMLWVSFGKVEPNGIPHVGFIDDGIGKNFEERYAYIDKKFSSSSVPVILKEIHLFEKELSKHNWQSVATFTLKPSL